MIATTSVETDMSTLDALVHHAPNTTDLGELAMWLQINGAAHLSLFERIELAERLVTRRRFLIGTGLLALGALTGCGSWSPVNPVTSVAPTAAGNTSLQVVALDEFAGLSILALGVKPTNVFLTFGYASAKAVFDAAGVQTVLASRDGGNLEALTALKPATIVGVSIPTTVAAQEKLELIAPTTVIEYTASWQDQLKVTGTAVGRAEAAAALIDRIERGLTTLKTDLSSAGKAGQTISVIGSIAGNSFALSRTGLVGSILEQVGLQRPAAQDISTEPTNPFITISAERLNDHDADVIFLLSGGAYNPDTLITSALWATLGAVKANRVVNVVAELWLSSNAFSVDWIVQDVRAALLGDGTVATESDIVNRWQTFVATQQ